MSQSKTFFKKQSSPEPVTGSWSFTRRSHDTEKRHVGLMRGVNILLPRVDSFTQRSPFQYAVPPGSTAESRSSTRSIRTRKRVLYQGPASAFSSPARYRGFARTSYAGWHHFNGKQRIGWLNHIGSLPFYQRNPPGFIRIPGASPRADLLFYQIFSRSQPIDTHVRYCHFKNAGKYLFSLVFDRKIAIVDIQMVIWYNLDIIKFDISLFMKSKKEAYAYETNRRIFSKSRRNH